MQDGGEILEVNGRSLLSVSHQDAVKMLKSSSTLMLTVRVEEVRREGERGFGGASGEREGVERGRADAP